MCRSVSARRRFRRLLFSNLSPPKPPPVLARELDDRIVVWLLGVFFVLYAPVDILQVEGIAGLTEVDAIFDATFRYVLPPLLVLWMIVRCRKGRRFRERARRAKFLLCTSCGYDLNGSAPEGACPECGTAYEPVEECSFFMRYGGVTSAGGDGLSAQQAL